MASGRQLAFQIDADKIEGQARLFVNALGDDLQPEGDQLCDQTTLGRFDLAPALAVFDNRQVGNGAIQAARDAELTRIVLREQPVAGRRCVEVGANVDTALRPARSLSGARWSVAATRFECPRPAPCSGR